MSASNHGLLAPANGPETAGDGLGTIVMLEQFGSVMMLLRVFPLRSHMLRLSLLG